MSAVKPMCCPKCGAEFEIDLETVLPDRTDLTLSLQISEGQMMRADTLGGLPNAFSELQKAAGDEMGCETTVFLKGLEMVDGTVNITTRIANTAKGNVEKQGELL